MSDRGITASTGSDGKRGTRGLIGEVLSERRAPLLQVGKSAAAAVAAWFVCLALYPGQAPVFGAIAALICVQPSVALSVLKGIERMIGVIAGVALSYVGLLVFGESGWLFVGVIIAALLLGWALRLTSPSTNQVAISGLLVLALGASNPEYALERIVETAIGAAIGTIVNVLVAAPSAVAPVHRAVTALGQHTAACLDRLADALTERRDAAWLDDMLQKARSLRGERIALRQTISAGEESLRLNPRRGRQRGLLQHDVELIARLDPVALKVRGMTRTVRDNYSPSLLADPTIAEIAEELRRAAHDLRLLARLPDEPGPAGPPATAELPALTSPLVVARPPRNWIVVGSLLEDIRRIREEILRGEEGEEGDVTGPARAP